MESFSTRGMPVPHKVAYWNALSSETFAAMEITPRNLSAFDGELRRELLGPLTVMDVRSHAVRIRHTKTHIAHVATPSYLLLTPLRGAFEMLVGREAPRVATTGDYCLLDHAQPYELQHGDAVRVLCLDIPRRSLELLLPHPESAVGRIMHADTGLSRLLAVLMREIGGELDHGPDAKLPPAVAQGLLGFIAATYAECSDDSLPIAAARRDALLRRIEARLHDPDLSPADIAVEFGITARRLRTLLAAGGESFSSYVLRRRLERCAELLSDGKWNKCSITDIAFRAGFNNATHFGYAFKKHFGTTPREYRAGHALRSLTVA